MKNLRNQTIYLYCVVKVGQFVQQGKWLTREQIQLHFSHLMQSLDEMGPISSQGGRNDQNTIQEDAEDVGTSKNEKIPKFIFSVFSMFQYFAFLEASGAFLGFSWATSTMLNTLDTNCRTFKDLSSDSDSL